MSIIKLFGNIFKAGCIIFQFQELNLVYVRNTSRILKNLSIELFRTLGH